MARARVELARGRFRRVERLSGGEFAACRTRRSGWPASSPCASRSRSRPIRATRSRTTQVRRSSPGRSRSGRRPPALRPSVRKRGSSCSRTSPARSTWLWACESRCTNRSIWRPSRAGPPDQRDVRGGCRAHLYIHEDLANRSACFADRVVPVVIVRLLTPWTQEVPSSLGSTRASSSGFSTIGLRAICNDSSALVCWHWTQRRRWPSARAAWRRHRLRDRSTGAAWR